jgi:hypothetical protein
MKRLKREETIKLVVETYLDDDDDYPCDCDVSLLRSRDTALRMGGLGIVPGWMQWWLNV